MNRREGRPGMRRQERQRVTVSDAMILVAATAVGMALTRLFLPSLEFAVEWFRHPRAGSLVGHWLGAVNILTPPLMTCPLAWTLALPALHWRRLGRRRMLRQPGVMTSTATAFTLAVCLVSVWFVELNLNV